MKKSTHPLMQLLVMLAMALGMLMISSMFVAVAAVAGADVTSGPGLLWYEAIVQLLTFALPVILMVVIYYRDNAREFCRLDFSGRRWYLALAGIVVLLLLMPAIDWLGVWNDGWNLGRMGEALRSLQDMTEGTLDGMLGGTSVGSLLGSLLVVALLPAVCEELFFRVGIQNLLQRWLKNPHAAIWFTALIFSLAHGEVFSLVPRVLLGALLGYLYVYGGSILPNMLAHFFNNAVVVVLYWLSARGVIDIDPEAPLSVGWLLTSCCTIAAVALFWFVFFGKKHKNSSL